MGLIKIRVLPAVLVALLAGCTSLGPAPDALHTATDAGWRTFEVIHEGFALTALSRSDTAGLPIRVYIEGDGRAWLDRYTPSPDPTPRRAVGLQLALLDPYPNVAYLARPCQYSRARSPACNIDVWTTRRFSPEMLEAMEAALEHLLESSDAKGFELVGYSGGAVMAVGLAARRSDVRALITVAGNLDPKAVNRFHGVDPMPSALDPMALAPAISRLPQWHVVGDRDLVIPRSLAQGFIAAGTMHRAVVLTLNGVSHERGWDEQWVATLEHIGYD